MKYADRFSQGSWLQLIWFRTFSSKKAEEIFLRKIISFKILFTHVILYRMILIADYYWHVCFRTEFKVMRKSPLVSVFGGNFRFQKKWKRKKPEAKCKSKMIVIMVIRSIHIQCSIACSIQSISEHVFNGLISIFISMFDWLLAAVIYNVKRNDNNNFIWIQQFSFLIFSINFLVIFLFILFVNNMLIDFSKTNSEINYNFC